MIKKITDSTKDVFINTSQITYFQIIEKPFVSNSNPVIHYDLYIYFSGTKNYIVFEFEEKQGVLNVIDELMDDEYAEAAHAGTW